jgi:hypothetical protein
MTHCGNRTAEIPQRSSLLPYRGVLSFLLEAREALAVMAWNRGASSPGELEITCNTSEIAASWFRASSNSCVRVSSFFSNSARLSQQ